MKDDQLDLINPARQLVYQFLSLALADPRARRWQRLLDPGLLAATVEAADVLRAAASARACALAPGELPAAQFDVRHVVRCAGERAFDAEVEYQQVFGLMMSKRHPPYESEYCPQTFSVYRAQVIADVAGFYRAFGLEPSRDAPERHDHIALELEFMAWMIFKEVLARRGDDPLAQDNADVCAAAGERFFREHVAWWVPAFAHALRRRRASGYYRALADLLAAFVYIERALLGVPAPTELVAPQPTEDTDAGCDQCCAIGGGDRSGSI